MKSPQLHFVVSAPRSGSTWLATALNRHPEIFATEHRLFGDHFEVWPNNNGRLAPRITLDAYARGLSVHYFHDQLFQSRSQFITDFIREYIDFLIDYAVRKSGKSIIVDKITPYPGTADWVMQQIRQYVPDAVVMKLVRDGRDVVTSGTFDWLMKDAHGTPRYRFFVDRENASELPRFFDDEVLKHWAGNWAETTAVFDDPSAALTIRYEDMLLDQAGVLSEVFALLQVADTPSLAVSCAEAATFEKMSGRRRGQLQPTAKQRMGVHGDWKQYFTRRDGDLFLSVSGNRLVTEGYEPGTAWLDDLPEHLSLTNGQTDARSHSR